MTVSLSIEGNNLRIVNSSGRKIDKWDSVGFDPQLVREGVITDTTRMAQVIKQALSESKLSTRNVRWAIPSIGSTSQILPLTQTGKSSLDVIVQREARRALSVSPETSYLYWRQLPSAETQQRVYVVAVPKETVQGLIQACQAAGVTIKSIDLRSLALARAVNQKDVIIAHGEINSVEMAIILDSLPSLMRGIWLREKDLDAGKVGALLLQQLASTIEYYNDMNRSNPLPANIPVCLTGEAALDPELAQRAGTLSNRVVTPLEPSVSYPEHFPLPLYMSNIGLILKSS
jgi:type IV pilus assembly protein PilM